jgi:hypothetical protein
MNRFAHQAPRNLSEMPTSWFVVPAVIWSVAVAAALVGPPSNDFAGAQSAHVNASEVAVTVEGA